VERAERADSIAHRATDDGRADGGAVLRADAAADGGAVRCADDTACPVAHGALADDSAHPVADDTACPVAHVTTRSVANGALADAAANPSVDDACTDGARTGAGADRARARADRAVARADRSETSFRDDGRLDAGDGDGRRYHRSSL